MLKQAELFSPDESSQLDGPLAILDLETTGTAAERDRVIEIGLVLMTQGRIEEEWSTLVNPLVGISGFIQGCTGINDDMVSDAPLFADVADALLQRLRNRTLVAHNARFDYGFLEQELLRNGRNFQAPALCTVKLSRKLFPGERKHSLDALIQRHALQCDNRHRALDDARVVADFIQVVRRSLPAESIDQAIRTQLKL